MGLELTTHDQESHALPTESARCPIFAFLIMNFDAKGFTFDEVANDDDIELVHSGLTFLIDPISYQYLIGATIDYKESLYGSQFVITNPNAITTCGCGSSFAI